MGLGRILDALATICLERGGNNYAKSSAVQQAWKSDATALIDLSEKVNG